jgi:hypothetical protein
MPTSTKEALAKKEEYLEIILSLISLIEFVIFGELTNPNDNYKMFASVVITALPS